jgi:hypothetical protein
VRGAAAHGADARHGRPDHARRHPQTRARQGQTEFRSESVCRVEDLSGAVPNPVTLKYHRNNNQSAEIQ